MTFHLRITQKPKVTKPVLIEGLPGIGHVGKLAASHLINELEAKKFAILHSDNFPPQVMIRKNGMIESMKNEFYFWRAEKKNQRDLIIVVGNTQSSTSDGQYALSRKILEEALKYHPELLFTLGGLGTGKDVEKPKVFGAVTHKKFIKELEELGVVVQREGIGQIIGVSGLLLALAKLDGLNGACLMGETSGFYIDPNSARAVLKVLCDYLHLDVDLAGLTKKAKDAKKRVAEAQRMERKMMEDLGVIQREPTEEEMRYIG